MPGKIALPFWFIPDDRCLGYCIYENLGPDTTLHAEQPHWGQFKDSMFANCMTLLLFEKGLRDLNIRTKDTEQGL